MELSGTIATTFTLVCSKAQSHRNLRAPDDLVRALQKMVADYDPNGERHKKFAETKGCGAHHGREQEKNEDGVEITRLVEAIEKAQFNYYRSRTAQEASRFLAVSSNMLLLYTQADINDAYYSVGGSVCASLSR